MELSAFFSFSRARASITELLLCRENDTESSVCVWTLLVATVVGGARNLQFYACACEKKMAADGGRCVFCRIAAKEETAEIVYEDSEFVCFRDRSPAATHHYLLIPRTHIRSGNVSELVFDVRNTSPVIYEVSILFHVLQKSWISGRRAHPNSGENGRDSSPGADSAGSMRRRRQPGFPLAAVHTSPAPPPAPAEPSQLPRLVLQTRPVQRKLIHLCHARSHAR